MSQEKTNMSDGPFFCEHLTYIPYTMADTGLYLCANCAHVAMSTKIINNIGMTHTPKGTHCYPIDYEYEYVVNWDALHFLKLIGKDSPPSFNKIMDFFNRMDDIYFAPTVTTSFTDSIEISA